MIKLHFEKKHGRVSPETVQAFKTIADAEVHRLATEGNLQSYILSQCDGLVCGCGVVFTEKYDLQRHLKRAKSCSADSSQARKETLFKTVCGRLVEESALPKPSAEANSSTELSFLLQLPRR